MTDKPDNESELAFFLSDLDAAGERLQATRILLDRLELTGTPLPRRVRSLTTLQLANVSNKLTEAWHALAETRAKLLTWTDTTPTPITTWPWRHRGCQHIRAPESSVITYPGFVEFTDDGQVTINVTTPLAAIGDRYTPTINPSGGLRFPLTYPPNYRLIMAEEEQA